MALRSRRNRRAELPPAFDGLGGPSYFVRNSSFQTKHRENRLLIVAGVGFQKLTLRERRGLIPPAADKDRERPGVICRDIGCLHGLVHICYNIDTIYDLTQCGMRSFDRISRDALASGWRRSEGQCRVVLHKSIVNPMGVSHGWLRCVCGIRRRETPQGKPVASSIVTTGTAGVAASVKFHGTRPWHLALVALRC